MQSSRYRRGTIGQLLLDEEVNRRWFPVLDRGRDNAPKVPSLILLFKGTFDGHGSAHIPDEDR